MAVWSRSKLLFQKKILTNLMKSNIRSISSLLSLSDKSTNPCVISQFARPIKCMLHTSSERYGLMEFFDNKDNWGESSVRVGRPWKVDELRLKSNQDLHKLWYVLLKERNMLMTMEEEYKRETELMPSPERLEKVEESMENVLDVVNERDRAYNLLEKGETGEPGVRWAHNQLGLGYWRKCQQHYVPLHMSKKFSKYNRFNGQWQTKYMQLLRERTLLTQKRSEHLRAKEKELLRKAFPDSDID